MKLIEETRTTIERSLTRERVELWAVFSSVDGAIRAAFFLFEDAERWTAREYPSGKAKIEQIALLPDGVKLTQPFQEDF